MKYIRTKDGRIIKFDTRDVEEEIAGIKYDILGFRLKTTMQFYNLEKEDIVKITDTIEELCDEFVLFRDNKPYAIVPNKEHNAELAKDVWKNYRGAIWTDQGLTYVAKTNKKGELELL